MKLTKGLVTYDMETLPYYCCRLLHSNNNPYLNELVLLHGAAFTNFGGIWPDDAVEYFLRASDGIQ